MDFTIGCFVPRKCLVACLFFEESQQPIWPQVSQSRRCTQVSPILTHSSQTRTLGLRLRILSVGVQVSAIASPRFLFGNLNWDAHGEARVAGHGIHGNLPVHAGYDAVDEVEPQTGAFAYALGSEKRL